MMQTSLSAAIFVKLHNFFAFLENKKNVELVIAALIFSAGYYCARIFFSFVKLFFALPFCRSFDILREIFLTSLG